MCFEHIFLPVFHKMYKSRMIDQYLKNDVSHIQSVKYVIQGEEYSMILLLILIFLLFQLFILLCCVAAGNDAASQEISDQEQLEFIREWKKKHPLR